MDVLVESDSEGVIEIIPLCIPSGIQQQRHAQGRDHLPIPQDPKRHDRMSCHFDLPKYESRNTDHHPNYQRNDDIGSGPLVPIPAGQS